MFEHRHERLIPFRRFLLRMGLWALAGVLLVGISLAGGTMGYRYFEGMTWIDALLNAAMILTGMGPAHELKTDGGKLFATGYALYSGVIFVTVTAVTLTPLLHRLLHHFHLEAEAAEDEPSM